MKIRKFVTPIAYILLIVGLIYFLLTKDWQASNLTLYFFMGCTVILYGNRITYTRLFATLLVIFVSMILILIDLGSAFYFGMWWAPWDDINMHTFAGVLLYLCFSSYFPKMHPFMILFLAVSWEIGYELYEFLSATYIGPLYLEWDLVNTIQDIIMNTCGGLIAMFVEYKLRRYDERKYEQKIM